MEAVDVEVKVGEVSLRVKGSSDETFKIADAKVFLQVDPDTESDITSLLSELDVLPTVVSRAETRLEEQDEEDDYEDDEDFDDDDVEEDEDSSDSDEDDDDEDYGDE